MTRRWFRFAFTLRTLFVLLTAFALWLGWQVRIIKERKAVIAEARRVDEELFEDGYIATESLGDPELDYAKIPLVRKLLGDEACFRMWLPESMGREWIARAEVAFPESALFVPDKHGFEGEFRDSLYALKRVPNWGRLFKTGIPDPRATGE